MHQNIRWINRDRFAPWLPALVIIHSMTPPHGCGWSTYSFWKLIDKRCTLHLSQAKSPDLNPSKSCFQLTSNLFLGVFLSCFQHSLCSSIWGAFCWPCQCTALCHVTLDWQWTRWSLRLLDFLINEIPGYKMIWDELANPQGSRTYINNMYLP